MRVLGLDLDPRALKSRVALRIFVVFATCSILPVAAFGAFAFWQVREQVEADARAALRSATRAAGMSILERLMIADEELKLFAELGRRSSPLAAPRASLAKGRIRSVRTWRRQQVQAALAEDQVRQLGDGAAVLLVTPLATPPARIELLRAGDPGSPDTAAWVAELDPEFVFVPRRRNLGERYWVTNARGELLFESPQGAASVGSGIRVESDPSNERSFSRIGSDGPELGASWSIFLKASFLAESWSVSFSRPRSEVERPLREFEATFPLVALASLGIAVTLSLVQIRRSFGPIDGLSAATQRLSRGDFDARVAIHTGDEFEELGRTFNQMAAELGRQIRVLRAVNRVGRALSSELNTESLLELILRESARVTDSAGAVLFLALDGAPLRLARLRMERPSREPLAGSDALQPIVARRCLSRGVTLSAAGLSDLPEYEQGAWRSAEASLGVSVGSQVAVPMRDASGDGMGVLILFREAGAAGYDSESCELVESLASQAATAIAKNHIVDSFRALFEGVIQLTVRAIDEKSGYTGDHCRKVPILTELIADAACAATQGPLKDFDLSEDERYELRIAALLHDCGKVATPVHVMDKTTKLETITDRIQQVDARFEILRREVLAGASELSREERAGRLAELEDDRLFLHACNRGSESMPDADVRRVRAIAAARGYVAVDGTWQPVLSGDEVENLCIQHGTLNPQERKVIEHHVVTTIELLSALPFPRALRAVPEIAGSHHERVDGGGYPNRLTRDQISLQGRILGLADVFEALTARDRPYKEGRTLSETFRILEAMRDEGAIDPDLYDLFKQEKVYLPYLAENVAPEQIDGDYWDELERFTGRA